MLYLEYIEYRKVTGAEMRKILFKNLTGGNNKKRDFSICEIVEKDGIVVKTEQRCVYFIRGKTHLKHHHDLQELKAIKKRKGVWRKKHFYITRSYNARAGENELTCKVAGTLYIIVEQDVFYVTFIHSFKMNMLTVSADKNKT